MERSYCVNIENAEGLHRAEGAICGEDLAVLDRYLAQVEQLLAVNGVREGLPCNFSMSLNIQTLDGELQAHLPDDDTLAAVLHRLRPLILQREAASFVNTCAAIGRNVPDATIRTVLREKRGLFENSDRSQTWAFSADNVRVNAESVLQDWLNGMEYHTDAERRARIEQLLAGAEVGVRYSLVAMLLNKINSIRAIDALARVLLGHSPEERFASPTDQEHTVTIRACSS
ncbi:MAG: hypothetical protein ACXWN1_10405 [Thermoanaerobaculia bacterium]